MFSALQDESWNLFSGLISHSISFPDEYVQFPPLDKINKIRIKKRRFGFTKQKNLDGFGLNQLTSYKVVSDFCVYSLCRDLFDGNMTERHQRNFWQFLICCISVHIIP